MPAVRPEILVEPKHRAMGMHGLIALITIAIAMLREHSPATNSIPGEEYLNQHFPPGVSRQKPRAKASTTTSSTFSNEQRQALMSRMLNMAMEDLTATSTPEELQEMQADIRNNFDQYLEENQEDITHVLANSRLSANLLRTAEAPLEVDPNEVVMIPDDEES